MLKKSLLSLLLGKNLIFRHNSDNQPLRNKIPNFTLKPLPDKRWSCNFFKLNPYLSSSLEETRWLYFGEFIFLWRRVQGKIASRKRSLPTASLQHFTCKNWGRLEKQRCPEFSLGNRDRLFDCHTQAVNGDRQPSRAYRVRPSFSFCDLRRMLV